ncbi:MAG TPA: hypothetical protein PLP19_22610, partial [bacterium]|nr:hypothetical protein [bacterium]HPN46292.1 hypothetical protein [bacterium]
MRRLTAIFYIMTFLFLLLPVVLLAQLDDLHGEFTEFRPGIHSGNQIRMTIWNDGQIGTKEARNELIALEWPINSGFAYFGQSMIKVGSEVKDIYGDVKHIFSESNGWRPNDPTDPGSGDMGPDGEWFTFLPLPGFVNPESDYLAMSHLQNTWPAKWPDKQDDVIEPGWPGSWNGYFGKNIKNADQESYFVMDDYNNKEFSFYPDSTNLERRGLGMRITARGLQWSNALVEDIFFALYDVKNISTTNYTKVVFAQFVGAAIGNTVTTGGDNGDDNGSFVLEERLVYSFDEDNQGNSGWTPVGYYGCAFLESPGNPYDGIDNDFDGKTGIGKTISEAMFVPTTLSTGNVVIVIDYKTYKRTKVTLNDTLRIPHNDKTLKFWPGQIVEEIPHNLIDDNLNGIIDENNGSTFGEPGSEVTTYLYIGNKYIDFFTNEGLDNAMIDEYRDDGIDNDNDWNILLDDVGLDGVPFSGDYGEGDGNPTSGWLLPGVIAGLEGNTNQFGLIDSNLPGEPHIDKTDIDESDMIGLTSFYLYTPWSLLPAHDDELIWQKTKPGYLDDRSQNSDTDFTFSSGYFPVNAGQIERFSIAHIMGVNLDDLLINKDWADKAYEENYNFSKAPNIPTLSVVPGNNCVTLYWDNFAELSEDPILGQDFEGYKIYRSTDPGWNDMDVVTDGYGFATYRKPLAQFDIINEYSGYSPVPIKGVDFWLGDNNGIVNSFVDSTAKNGFTYYYAVTSYDRGDPARGIAPSECSKYISISASGVIEKGTNVQRTRPEAPTAGYIPANIDSVRHMSGISSGLVGYQIIDPNFFKDKHTYRVVFQDEIVYPTTTTIDRVTRHFSLLDVTNTADIDTLIKESTAVNPGDALPIIDGFQLQFSNETGTALNT